MPISGLMVRVAPGEVGAAELEALRGWPEVTIGERQGDWVAVAVESRDPGHGRDLHERMERLPGVVRVEVVSVHFEADGEGAASGRADGGAIGADGSPVRERPRHNRENERCN
ncbi:MAG: hypothetical protein KF833_00680 [Verrucomicrobiae bacterium]|nr:hypothetical protein [Verrucomicrobiae bacterium]